MSFAILASVAAVLSLLNSRSAGSPAVYERSLAEVRADAEAGKLVQMFVYAITVPKDPKAKDYITKSRPKIEKLAKEKNNALAWYLLSVEDQSVEELQKAAAGKNVQALNAMGTMILNAAMDDNKLTREERNSALKDAFMAFNDAAKQKDPNGLYNLGMCYMNGYGCEPDGMLGFNSFKTAAELGHPEAINNIGGCYRDGIVVEQDYARAAKWFKKACDLGNRYGQINYGLALQRGEGVEQNEKAAFELFQKASEQGSPEADNLIAMCYYKGRGVVKDDKIARAFFKKSAAAGFVPAKKNLEDMDREEEKQP